MFDCLDIKFTEECPIIGVTQTSFSEQKCNTCNYDVRYMVLLLPITKTPLKVIKRGVIEPLRIDTGG